MLSEMKRSIQVQNIKVTWSIIKLSERNKDRYLEDDFYYVI